MSGWLSFRGSGPHHTGNGVSIEPMRKKHLRQILAIEQQVYPKPWTHGVFSSELEQARLGRRWYIVARRIGKVVGYGGVMFTDDRLSDGEAHVTNVAVEPSCWRSGVGRTLMLALIHEARRRGCTSMSLEVRATNQAAQELYRQLGFAPAGIRQRYYENRDDAIVMWCHDVHAAEYGRRLEELESRDAR
jgi:[ribosomal protein S18]-alanine N-acetyltransferase